MSDDEKRSDEAKRLDALAAAYYAQQASQARQAAQQSQALWVASLGTVLGGISRKALEQETIPRLIDVIETGQRAAAKAAAPYVSHAARIQGVNPPDAIVRPEAFVTPRATTEKMMRSAVRRAEILHAAQAPDRVVALRTTAQVVRMSGDLVADAGRNAESVQIMATPDLDAFTRQVHLPACKTCAHLGGKIYRWHDTFVRHPGCDCTHVPLADASDKEFAKPLDVKKAVKKGQIQGLTPEDEKALRKGDTDLGAVVAKTNPGLRAGIAYGDRPHKMTPEELLKLTNKTRKRTLMGLRVLRYVVL